MLGSIHVSPSTYQKQSYITKSDGAWHNAGNHSWWGFCYLFLLKGEIPTLQGVKFLCFPPFSSFFRISSFFPPFWAKCPPCPPFSCLMGLCLLKCTFCGNFRAFYNKFFKKNFLPCFAWHEYYSLTFFWSLLIILYITFSYVHTSLLYWPKP